MIYYSIPWDSNKDIIEYYNGFMETLPSDEDWACFIDSDACFTTNFYGRQLERAIENNPNAKCFTCYVSKINLTGAALWQMVPEEDMPNGMRHHLVNNDMRYHREIGIKIAQKYEEQVVKILPENIMWTENQETSLGGIKWMSGTLILIQKKLWKNIGKFKVWDLNSPDRFMQVDNKLHRDITDWGEHVYLMKDVYLYHWYRGVTGGLERAQWVKSKKIEITIGNKKELVSPVLNKKLTLIPKNKIIYTAILDKKEKLRAPKHITQDWKYICITNDEDLKPVAPWEILHIVPEDIVPLDNEKTKTKCKIMSDQFLPEHDLSIWIDNSAIISGDLNELVRKYPFDFVSVIHPDRNCLYEEGKVCFESQKDKDHTILNQCRTYIRKGFPKGLGLFETKMLMRYSTKRNKNICTDWWNEISSHSHLDQLSFTYILWKNSYQIKGIKNDDYISFFMRKKKDNLIKEKLPLCRVCQNL